MIGEIEASHGCDLVRSLLYNVHSKLGFPRKLQEKEWSRVKILNEDRVQSLAGLD